MSPINTWSDRFFKIILIMAFFFILVLLTIVSVSDLHHLTNFQFMMHFPGIFGFSFYQR